MTRPPGEERAPRHVEALWRGTRWLHRRRAAAGRCLLAAAVLVFLATGFTTVRTGEVGLKRTLGRLDGAPAPPGLTWVPPLLSTVARVPTGTQRQLVLARRDGSPLELLTADENLVSAKVQVQYRVEDAAAFRFSHREAEKVLRSAAVSALTEEVGATPVEALLTSGKGPLQEAVRRRAQTALDVAGTGLRIAGVSVLSAGPPPGAEDAFTAVANAASERERRVSEADGRRSETLALSRAEAERLGRQAASSRIERVEGARGASRRFLALAREIAPARAAGLSSLQRDAVARILSRARVVALPARGSVETIRAVLSPPGGRSGEVPAPPAAKPPVASPPEGPYAFPTPSIVPPDLQPRGGSPEADRPRGSGKEPGSS